MNEPRFVVDLQVTGKCNLACDFCDGAPKEYIGAPLPDVLTGIDKLVAAGLTTLNISGGEPLIRKDTPQIIAHARSKGLEVYLSTNGIMLRRIFDKVAPNISTLGLPLDGSTTEMNIAMTRGPLQFDTTIGLLADFQIRRPPFGVKVGTVVSAINIDDISNIGRVIFQDQTIHPPDVWRLYEFTPLGDGLWSKARHSISTDSFFDVVAAVKAMFPTQTIVPLSNQQSNDSYIFIDPRMLIQVYTNDDYKVVGDLREATIDELVTIKENNVTVVEKGGRNRNWLSMRALNNA